MLHSRTIPQYGNHPEDWHRFIEKVAKGSSKAHNVLSHADMAYMVALTGDHTSPETLHLNDYATLFREAFPLLPPKQSTNELIQLAADCRWIPHSFVGVDNPRNDPSHYCNLWKRSRTVDWTALLNDALLSCLTSWSPDDCLACMNEDSCDFDSRVVLSGMLYLALTWPDT